MTELKTLKDLEKYEERQKLADKVRKLHLEEGSGYNESNFCNSCVHQTQLDLFKELKQEAIKWIKEEQNKEFHTEPTTLIEGFIEFFNITGENLK
jgi:hypothetical protein